jgi:hypothetical protein
VDRVVALVWILLHHQLLAQLDQLVQYHKEIVVVQMHLVLVVVVVVREQLVVILQDQQVVQVVLGQVNRIRSYLSHHLA